MAMRRIKRSVASMMANSWELIWREPRGMVGRLRERPTGRISQKFSFKFIMKIPPQMAANIRMRVRVLPATVSVAA